MHGDLFVTPPSGARIARDNVSATGISASQRSVSRSFTVEKRGQNALWSNSAESLIFSHNLEFASHRSVGKYAFGL